MGQVEVVSAHHERAVIRVSDTYLKIEPNESLSQREVDAMALAPVPVPTVLWWRHPVLALTALPGRSLGRLGQASTAPATAWMAAGAAARRLHEAPVPPWPGWDVEGHVTHLDGVCAALVDRGLVAREVVDRNRRAANAALRPFERAFIHGDLQAEHVLVDGDEVTGVLDWSDALAGDPLFDLAVLTVGHGERLDDVLRGYGTEVDRDVISGWWAFRRLCAVVWMDDHGFDPSGDIAALTQATSPPGAARDRRRRKAPSPGGGG